MDEYCSNLFHGMYEKGESLHAVIEDERIPQDRE
jgi:hypothetical protein